MKEDCIHCGYTIIDEVDTTYSNIGNEYVQQGELTGTVFQCRNCEELQIDNYLSGKTEPFSY